MSYSDQLQTSSLNGGNTAYIEALYDLYLLNPTSIPEEWQRYFAGLTEGKSDPSLTPLRQRFFELAHQTSTPLSHVSTGSDKQAQVNALIDAYRRLGHLLSKLDPLNLKISSDAAELQLSFHHLSIADLSTEFDSQGLFPGSATLKDILSRLQNIYCGTVASEFMYMSDVVARRFVQDLVEKKFLEIKSSKEEKQKLLESLTAAEGWERYLATKFVGQKRFSLEGCDTLIPMMQHLVQLAAGRGVAELAIGMPHRGRLNVAVNVVGKPPQDFFDHFAGQHEASIYSGDVKYHLGYAADVQTATQPIRLSLAFNPSHLEIIGSVLEGAVYARQKAFGDAGFDKVLPVVMHGDASIAGQGVVMEALNFSQVAGYKTGGTIHIVVNNQVGFTTDEREARSARYSTDIAKMTESPVFHVNADDPEAVLRVMECAFEFRMRFKQDVFIELLGYRRLGHNEADEPMATQPVLYSAIRARPTVRALYAQKLIAEQVIDAQAEQALQDAYRDKLDRAEVMVPVIKAEPASAPFELSNLNADIDAPVDTTVPLNTLKTLGETITTLPEGFVLQAQVDKVIHDRQKMVSGELPLDWGCAETLAYATLLNQGISVRISGEDVQRSTFAYRHAVLHDQKTGECYTPLEQLVKSPSSSLRAPSPQGGEGIFVEIYNSILSEEAVMGFEYGVAGNLTNHLNIWEAQYGDFANGAQMVVDQFLASGEQKWKKLSPLTLFLPHGYEGAGPEHSSARLERYLQLCAQNNMFVCMLTTPAQTFHMLRRQALAPFKKPLIVMTPKNMLRNKQAVSSLEELSSGHFQKVISDLTIESKKAKRILFCSGKVYYDLLQKRMELKREDVALVRIEQLYPFPADEIAAELKRYTKAKEFVFVQEEPRNMGAWNYLRGAFLDCFTDVRLVYVGRPASASTAAGYGSDHTKELQTFLETAFK